MITIAGHCISRSKKDRQRCVIEAWPSSFNFLFKFKPTPHRINNRNSLAKSIRLS